MTVEPMLLAAARAAADGDERPLLDLLRSNTPLSGADKGLLADLIEAISSDKRLLAERLHASTIRRLRGKPPAKPGSNAYNREQIVRGIKDVKKTMRAAGQPVRGIEDRSIEFVLGEMKKAGLPLPRGGEQAIRNRLRRSRKKSRTYSEN